jgi:septum formation inhibitor-activating ATPase MinD
VGKRVVLRRYQVEANASLDSMRSRSLMEHGLEVHLVGIFPEEEQPPEGANTLQNTAVRPAGQEGQALSEANARQHRWIAQAGRQQREVLRWG